MLSDKIRRPDGKLVPWRSPDGKPMAIRAAYPRWPWSDLIDALLPNGRFLDTQVAPFKQSLNPVGVTIQSYVGGLYALGQATRVLLRWRAGLESVHERRREHQPELRLPAGGPASVSCRQGGSEQHLPLPRRLRDRVPPESLTPGAALDPERLDRRPLPAGACAPHVQLRSVPIRQGLPREPPVRRPGSQPRLQQARHQPLLLQPGCGLLRPLPEGRAGQGSGPRVGDRVHPDLPQHHA